MINPTKISIICPVWNGLPFLKVCIESVLNQGFKDWEMLIRDDGSTDGSIEYLESLTDTRIKFFKGGGNLGIFGNLNFLFSRAQAEISQILCQDDYLIASDSLETIVGYWDQAPEDLGFVRFNHLKESSEIATIDLQQEISPSVIQPSNADLWFFIFGNVPGNLSNVSLRTSIVAELGGFNQSLPFAGDFEFWARAARRYAMGIENQAVVYVRRHEKVASNFLSLNGELFIQHIRIYELLINNLSALYNRRELVDYFNFEISSFHYRTGIRSAIYGGKFSYLNTFFTAESTITWPRWKRLSACLPLAIFPKNRLKMTVRKARQLINHTCLLNTLCLPLILN